MNKKETNKVIILVIVGLILAWAVGGFMGGFMGNALFTLAMMVVIFSGVFGEKFFVKASSIGVPLTIGIILATGTLGRWWQYVLCYIVAVLIGTALSYARPNHKQERSEWDNELNNELKYDLFVKDDNFAIKFPKKPLSTQAVHGHKMWHYTNKHHDGGVNYSVSLTTVENHDSKTRNELWKTLEKNTSRGFVDSGHLSEQLYVQGEILGIPCVTAAFQTPDSKKTTYQKVFIKDDICYVITVGSTLENINLSMDLFNKFFGSFRFIKSSI